VFLGSIYVIFLPTYDNDGQKKTKVDKKSLPVQKKR